MAQSKTAWRELDPVSAAESDRLLHLESKLMRDVRRVELSQLTVSDLLDILDVYRPKYDGHDFDDEDANVLRRILHKVKT